MVTPHMLQAVSLSSSGNPTGLFARSLPTRLPTHLAMPQPEVICAAQVVRRSSSYCWITTRCPLVRNHVRFRATALNDRANFSNIREASSPVPLTSLPLPASTERWGGMLSHHITPVLQITEQVPHHNAFSINAVVCEKDRYSMLSAVTD